MKSSRKLAVMAAAVVTAASGASALLGVPTASAATSGGTPVIVNPTNNVGLNFGTSSTTWTFKMPAAPAGNCTGDSATGFFFVYTYIAPVAISPLSLTFGSNGPNQAGSFPLFDTAGSPMIAATTAPQTGQVISFPSTQFDFAKFGAPGSGRDITLPAGRYNIGVACAKGGVTDKVWNTLIDVSTTACDVNGEIWAIPGQTNPAGQAHLPTAARNLAAAPGGLLSFAVNVSWAPPADTGCSPVHYQILRGTAAGAETPLTTVSGTSFTDSGHTLDILTTFYYKVVAVNATGSGPVSNEASSKAEPWNLIPL